MVNVAAIYSTLGNPDSLIPLLVKDMSATAGMTAGSFATGKEEGQDRFIDEVGTQIIWLLGIPCFKKIFDKTIFKAYGLDPVFDVRNLKNKDIFNKIKEYAPDKKVKTELEKISKKQGLFKNIALYKFFFATGATIASYIGLTKAKQKYTENKIRNNLIAEYNKSKQAENNNKTADKTPAFKGIGNVVKNFAFSPVKNMYLLDGAITAERLTDSRTPQEFAGYAIKEASTLCFLYYAGGKIQQIFEKSAINKHNKSIALDARVLEGGNLQKAFEDGSIKKSLEEFKNINSAKDIEIYDFIHKNQDNEIIKAAKESDLIKMYKKTNKIDTRYYIDLKKIKSTYENVNQLYSQYLESMKKGESSQKFFTGVKKLKRHSVIMNIATCIFALGIITPAIMLGKRLFSKDDAEFQTKKEIRNQLIKEGVIS